VSEHRWAHFSLSRAVFWALLIAPSILLGWVYSIAFVSACSLYANAASDFAAWRADRNKEIVNRLASIEAKLDQLAKEGAD